MKTILLIDDSRTQLMSLKLFLTRNNFNVITAENGIEGYNKIWECPPDIVICDVMMPNLNGYQFCRLLKDSPLTKPIPIMLFTSLNQNIDKFWGKQSGADIFASKNADLSEILEKVNLLIVEHPVDEGVKKTILNTHTLKNALQTQVNNVLDASLMEATIMNEFRKLSKNVDNSEKFLNAFFQLISSIFNYNLCSIYFYDENFTDRAKVYVSSEQYTYSNDVLKKIFVPLLGEDIIIEDILTNEQEKTSTENINFQSELCLDLAINDVKLAKLSLFSYENVDYSSFQFFETVKSEIALIAKIRNLYAQTKYLSITDGLTSLYNRRYFFENIEREFARSLRYKSPLSVAMLDIDYFKKINDTYGHQAGDEILKFLANTMLKALRKTDLIFRYGGEEIIILLPETDIYKSVIPLERLRVAIEKSLVAFEENEMKFTVSIGLAQKNDDVKTFDELISHADDALYRAKNNGRNRIELYE